MSESLHDGGDAIWPSAGVLVLCAGLLVAGYGAAVLRGPTPAQEVRVLQVPAPPPVPAAE